MEGIFSNKNWHFSYLNMLKLWKSIPVTNQHCYMWIGFSKQNVIKDITRTKLSINTLDALMCVSLIGLDISEVEWWRVYEIWHSAKERRIHDICWKYQTMYLFYFIISILETKTIMWYLFSFYMHNLVKLKKKTFLCLFKLHYLFIFAYYDVYLWVFF